jgi:hypothetical protein
MESEKRMDLTRVRAALTGVEEDQAPKSPLDQHSLLSHLVNPPSYFVYLLLRLVGFKSYQMEEVSTRESTSSNEFVEKINQKLELERIASYNACAMIAFFFSYTDLIFDILFALSLHPTMSFQEFRLRSWRERFNIVLPMAQNRHLSQMYQQLLRMKQIWRDVPLHGFGGNAALLVPVPGLGLIPCTGYLGYPFQ